MVWLAAGIWRGADTPKHLGSDGRSRAATTAQMFALTLANPMTILTFLALFIGAGVGLAGYEYSAALTLGVFTGSLVWWIVLSGIVSVLRERVDDRTLRWVNRASALLIAGFALWIAAQLLQG